MERSFFEELATSMGLPNPTNEQIKQIKKLHKKRSTSMSDDEIISLYLKLKVKIDNVMDSIDENEGHDKQFYDEYFHSYPLLYFSTIPRYIIKSKLDNSEISEIIFSSIPDPISIQDSRYEYLHEDMEKFYKIYKMLENKSDKRDLHKLILDPIKLIETSDFKNVNGLLNTLRNLNHT